MEMVGCATDCGPAPAACAVKGISMLKIAGIIILCAALLALLSIAGFVIWIEIQAATGKNPFQ